ncbi:hypothetical protein [Paractinoplanes ferrugineus]|uniref:hypothetical protein n=1 Tax=Paractinoplanes ferrugineus TaxID=113564 RepID=UPI0019430855|nr:hypothetical protein [Actinoplanes ferrugineus]
MAGLYHLGPELENDGRVRVFEGRAPDGLRVAVRVGEPGGGRPARQFRSPPPWSPGHEPAGDLVTVQVFAWVDDLARVVHGEDTRPATAMRAQPPAADPDRDPVFREMTIAAARNAARPPARVGWVVRPNRTVRNPD